MTRFYSITFERSYRDNTGQYRYTRSFNPDDLGALMARVFGLGEHHGCEGKGEYDCESLLHSISSTFQGWAALSASALPRAWRS